MIRTYKAPTIQGNLTIQKNCKKRQYAYTGTLRVRGVTVHVRVCKEINRNIYVALLLVIIKDIIMNTVS